MLVSYDSSTFNKLLKINTPEFSVLYSPPHQVLMAMEEDGRFRDNEWPEDQSETAEFLAQCLQDENELVRKAAEMAIGHSRRSLVSE
ncbi:hypothetical protein ACFLWV_04120 [Chloroflexota bacterium]